jgi:DNA-binding protein H-NS
MATVAAGGKAGRPVRRLPIEIARETTISGLGDEVTGAASWPHVLSVRQSPSQLAALRAQARLSRQSEAEEKMNHSDLRSMTIDQLWSLHERVSEILARKIAAEKAQLDERLRQLGMQGAARRRYPQVFPKYRNPDQPAETWSGRGKRPRWLTAQLRSGKNLDDFRIADNHMGQSAKYRHQE